MNQPLGLKIELVIDSRKATQDVEKEAKAAGRRAGKALADGVAGEFARSKGRFGKVEILSEADIRRDTANSRKMWETMHKDRLALERATQARIESASNSFIAQSEARHRNSIARYVQAEQAKERTVARNRILEIRRSEIAAAQMRNPNAAFVNDKQFLIGSHGQGVGQLAGSKMSSRNLMVAFQLQQAVEDATYAGFRGAANNLALIASQTLGPQLGMVALGGLVAVTLAPLIGQMLGVGDAAEESNKKIKEQIDLFQRLQDVQLESHIGAADRRREGRDTLDAELETDADKVRRDIDRQTTRAMAMRDRAGMKGLMGGIAQRNPEAVAGFLPGTTQELDDLLAVQNEQLKERRSILEDILDLEKREKALQEFSRTRGVPAGPGGRVVPAASAERERLSASVRNQQEIVKARMRAAGLPSFEGELRSEQAKEEQRKSVAQVEADIAVSAKKRAEAVREAATHDEALLATTYKNDKANDFIVKQLEEQSAEFRTQRELRQRITEGATAQEIADRGFDSRLEQQNAKYRKRIELIEKERKASKTQADFDAAEAAAIAEGRAHKAITDEIMRQQQIGKEILSVSREELSIAVRTTKEKMAQIEAQQKLIETAMKGQRASRDSFESTSFGLARSASSKFLGKQADQAKQQDAVMLAMLGADPRLIAARAEAIDRIFEQAIQQRDKQIVDMRMKFLRGNADAAGEAGDFERQREMLGELQRLQFENAGSATTMGGANAAFIQAKETQALIEETFTKEKMAAEGKISLIQGEINSLSQLQQRIQAVADTSANMQIIKDADIVRANAMNVQLSVMLNQLAALGAGMVGAPQLPGMIGGGGGFFGNIGQFVQGLGTIPGFASGGLVGGPSGVDSVPAWLSRGEFVMNPEAVRNIGAGVLDRMNSGSGVDAVINSMAAQGRWPSGAMANGPVDNRITMGTVRVETRGNGFNFDEVMQGVAKARRTARLKAGRG